jgi:hypothetical protein
MQRQADPGNRMQRCQGSVSPSLILGALLWSVASYASRITHCGFFFCFPSGFSLFAFNRWYSFVNKAEDRERNNQRESGHFLRVELMLIQKKKKSFI